MPSLEIALLKQAADENLPSGSQSEDELLDVSLTPFEVARFHSPVGTSANSHGRQPVENGHLSFQALKGRWQVA
jgi:hypothetical protein